jgi:hypothetical protein
MPHAQSRIQPSAFMQDEDDATAIGSDPRFEIEYFMCVQRIG